MIFLRELIDDLGGGRNIGLGACLVVGVYVAADNYVETIEERLAALDRRISQIEERESNLAAWRGPGSRFTAEQGAELARRIEFLEKFSYEHQGPK